MSLHNNDPFVALSRAFSAASVRWYVFGAQAAILHGAVRLTEDIDVTVDGSTATAAELITVLAQEQIELRIHTSIEAFVEKTRVLPMLHRPSKVPIDVVISGPGIEELFFEHIVSVDMDGVDVPLAAAEDVIVMKILAGRPKDIEDVVAVMVAQKGTLDLGRVRELLMLLEEALGQSDLLPALEAAARRAKRT